MIDPNCAICDQPAEARCNCENESLRQCVVQAEHRQLTSKMNEMRDMVLQQARSWVLGHYTRLITERNRRHQAFIAELYNEANYYRLPLDQGRAVRAEFDLRQGINEDWRSSVRLYPEILDYFYGQVMVSFNQSSELDELPVDQPPPRSRPPKRYHQSGQHRSRGEEHIRHSSRSRHHRQRSSSHPPQYRSHHR